MAVEVNYFRGGSGSPLLLIHGIGHRWQAWEPVLDQLRAHHDVIAVDLPGFGKSLLPAGGITGDMPTAVDRVAHFIHELGVERPHVAGNSLGGAIALELASLDLVASATALSPAGFFTPRDQRRAMATLGVMRASALIPTPIIRLMIRSRLLRAIAYGPIVAHPSRLSLDRMVEDALALRHGRGFWPTARATRHYQFTGEPDVPVAIGWGDRDRILPVTEAAIARDRLPKANHITLTGCGHVPMSDDPDQVAKVILATASTHR